MAPDYDKLPSFYNLPYGVIKLILQYFYKSDKSAALRYRLVSKTFNNLMLKNIRLRLYYEIGTKLNRCQLSLKEKFYGWSRLNIISTDSLINSSLISRIFTLHIEVNTEDNWDQQDLISLASHLCDTVEVSLFFSYMPTRLSDSNERLLTSMCAAMPRLKGLNCFVYRSLGDPNEIGPIVSRFIRLCPATVKEFGLSAVVEPDIDRYVFIHSFTFIQLGRWEQHHWDSHLWESHFTNLFIQILDSNFTRVSIRSGVEPFWDAMPFQFQRCPNGEQTGMPEKTTNINWRNDVEVPANRYLLKKRNGQICQLYFNRW